MTFMEALEQDLQDTFFDLDEFGAPHTVDGTTMTAIIDDMENIEREKKMKSHMDGIHARQIILYVKTSEFGPLPAQGRIINLDSRKYTVLEAVDEGGVYSITLEANRSR